MRIVYFALLFSLSYSQYHSSEWGSITSLLTPTGIQITNEGIVYASTSGGLLVFNPLMEKFNFIKAEEGLVYLDLASIAIDSQERLWLGGAYPNACLQVYDPAIGLVEYIDNMNSSATSINKIQIGEDIAFAVFEGVTSSEIGIIEFRFESGLPVYQDLYTNFSDKIITEIHDLDIFQDSVYVTTDKGIFSGNYKDNLNFSERWFEIYTGTDAIQFLPGNSPLILGNGSIFDIESGDYCISFTGDLVHAKMEGDKIGILTTEYFHEISNCEINSFHIPVGDQNNIETENYWKYDHRTFFTSFDYSGDDNIIIGINDNGILSLDGDLENHVTFIPNSPIWRWHTNQDGDAGINASRTITITNSGHLVATSHFGVLYYNGLEYINYIPDLYYKYYSGSSETFHAINLDYYPGDGEHFPISIIEKDNGNLIYCNSGVGGDRGGAVIELSYTSGELLLIKYDSLNQTIDGQDGIFHENWDTHYMVVNQINKDKLGNIWIVNSYCERYENLLAIQSSYDDSWSHVRIPDENSYRPQTIALEDRGSYKRAWIGFENVQTLEPEGNDYSSGGIKVFEYTDLTFGEDDSTWISINNLYDLPGNSSTVSVWSVVFDKMGFLWILSEEGVQGYKIITGNNKITLRALREYEDEHGELKPYNFLTENSYEKGNRIKVDSQNNKWIITYQGVWVIQGSNTFWHPNEDVSAEDGLHPENCGLLSDKVYDVAFDDDKGLVYLATDKGISILQSPFADNPSNTENMYISPNPFIIPEDEFVTIKNIPAGATIQIMTITGLLIKKVRLEPEYSQYLWNGRNEKGEVVGTSVYLVGAHHPTEPNMVSKIAVIRK